jgi:hypothetical protein
MVNNEEKCQKKVNVMISEKKSITQEVFMSTIANKWEAIDRSLCLKLANSMSMRIDLVIESEGETIKY